MSPQAGRSAFDALRRRLDAAGIAHSYILDFDDEPMLRVDMPCGLGTRRTLVSLHRLAAFEAIALESIRYVDGFDAIVNDEDGVIEARLLSSARVLVDRHLRGIPKPEQEAVLLEPLGEAAARGRVSEPEVIRVASRDGVWLEISPASVAMLALSYGRTGYSIKIPSTPGLAPNEIRERLERIAYSFLFDLDLRYGVSLELAPQRQMRRRRRSEPTPEPPRFPGSRYPAEPLALYRYGRAAQGLPLLEFLAYYQAIEFFFPYYSSASVISSLRAEIMDPRFRVTDDAALSRLVSLARPGGRTSLSEREQLRATLAACVDQQWANSALTVDSETRDHFCANRQGVAGVKKIQLTGSDVDLRHQIADRIYDIRCRIVHAKQDGGDSGVELLLPSGPEADALGPDIDLTRAIAQRVIVSRAQPLDLK